jgi:hypothetical protein
MPNKTSNTQDSDINEVTDFSQEFSEVEVVKDDSNVEVSDSEIKEINDELKEAINEDQEVFEELIDEDKEELKEQPDAAEEESSPPVENNSDSVVINKPVSTYDNESKFPYAIPDATLNTCPVKGY